MDKVETTLIQTPKLTKVDTMNGEQVSYKVTLLANQAPKAGETKSEVRRFVVPQDCSTSMVYLKEKLRLVIITMFIRFCTSYFSKGNFARVAGLESLVIKYVLRTRNLK